MYTTKSLSAADLSPLGIRNKWLLSARYAWATPEDKSACVVRARFWHRVWMRSTSRPRVKPLPQLSKRQAN